MVKKIMSRIALLAVLAVGFTSCEKDEDDPDFDFRDEYVGEWNAQFDSDEFGVQTYTVNISKSSSNADQIIIANFYNLGTSESVVVNASDNDLLISSQVVKANTIQGSGSSTANYEQINLTYTANDGAVTDNVTAVYGKVGLRLPWENDDNPNEDVSASVKK